MLTLPKEIGGHFHPTIIISPSSGKTYIVPDWIEVPKGTTINDIMPLWKPTKTSLPGISTNKETFMVKSTDGLRTYEVIAQNNFWSCTCPRYGFKKSCKHINNIRFNKQ
jgi:metallophosphoesterase superfamily enzyme